MNKTVNRAQREKCSSNQKKEEKKSL